MHESVLLCSLPFRMKSNSLYWYLGLSSCSFQTAFPVGCWVRIGTVYVRHITVILCRHAFVHAVSSAWNASQFYSFCEAQLKYPLFHKQIFPPSSVFALYFVIYFIFCTTFYIVHYTLYYILYIMYIIYICTVHYIKYTLYFVL